MNLFHLTILLVAVVATANALPKAVQYDRDSRESAEETDALPAWNDDERFQTALDRLYQGAANLIEVYPLSSINDYMSMITNDVFTNYDLFGYGVSQLYVREADNNVKGHQAQYHHYEHL